MYIWRMARAGARREFLTFARPPDSRRSLVRRFPHSPHALQRLLYRPCCDSRHLDPLRPLGTCGRRGDVSLGQPGPQSRRNLVLMERLTCLYVCKRTVCASYSEDMVKIRKKKSRRYVSRDGNPKN